MYQVTITYLDKEQLTAITESEADIKNVFKDYSNTDVVTIIVEKIKKH